MQKRKLLELILRKLKNEEQKNAELMFANILNLEFGMFYVLSHDSYWQTIIPQFI